MPRYIDAEVLKSRLEDFSRWCKDGRKKGVDFVLDCPLPDIPTADVQEVVRCKDCLHRDPEDKKCDCSFQARGGIFPMEDDDFCSCGERRNRDG